MILAIETSSQIGSISLLKEGQVVISHQIKEQSSISKDLLSEIDLCLKKVSANRKDISLIAVSNGFGSLTGIRVGISVAKGLAYSLAIKLVEVELLKAMKYVSGNKKCISILSGKGQKCYYQLEENKVQEVMIDELKEILNRYPEISIVVQSEISSALPELFSNRENSHFVSNLSELIGIYAFKVEI